MRLRYIIGLWLTLTALVLSGCGDTSVARNSGSSSAEGAGTVIDPPKELTNFTLPSSTGKEMSLSDFEGKPTVLFFGYTFCPDVCPMTLSEFKQVKADLGSEADNVNFVFVSVDGERDTPEVLAKHLALFDKSFVGLQGNDQTLRKIGDEYGLYYKKQQVEGTSAAYLVDHSSATYLLDSEGKLEMIYSFGTPPEVIAKDIRAMPGA